MVAQDSSKDDHHTMASGSLHCTVRIFSLSDVSQGFEKETSL